MYLFLCLFLPLTFFIFYATQEYDLKCFLSHNFRFFLAGVCVAFLYCFIELISTYSYVQCRNSIFFGMFRLYLFDFVIPFVLTIVLLFISSKKSYKERFEKIFDYMMGFYSVYSVFSSLLRYEKVFAFLLFEKPILFFCQILIVSRIIFVFINYIQTRASFIKLLPLILLFIIFSIVPSFLQAWKAVGYPVIIEIIVFFVYLFFGFYAFTKMIGKENFKEFFVNTVKKIFKLSKYK